MKRSLAGLLLALLWAAPLRADDPFAMDEESALPFKLSGLLDVRYARTSQQRSWLLGGSNKLRYGGADVDANSSGDRGASILSVPQASLLLDLPVPLDASVHLQLNLDADTDSGNASAGLIEAFAESSRKWRGNAFGVRLGAFIPPVSWEHPERAWSTRYTMTPSAIGSWVAEEVRAFGAEGRWDRGFGDHALGLTGGLFSGSDQNGWILVHRGWALHDYQPDLDASLSLPTGATERPFLELDGNMGHYERLRLSLFDKLVRLGGGFWDNEGRLGARSSRSGGQSVWSSEFWDFGGMLEHGGFTVIAQGLRGRTASRVQSWKAYQSWYALGSYRLGKWRLSERYDRFKVFGLEEGHAATTALMWDRNVRQRFGLEYISVFASPSAATFPRGRKDQIFQANARFLFGG